MKKLYLILLFCLLPMMCVGQINSLIHSKEDTTAYKFSLLSIWPSYLHSTFDYSSINEDEVDVNDLYNKLDSLIKYRDELRIQYQIDSISSLYSHINRDKKNSNYSSWYLSIGAGYSDYEELNRQLQENNIDELNPVSANAIWILGFSGKRNKLIHSAYLELSLPNKVKRNDLKISTNGLSLLNYDLGYVIIDRRRFHLYPYAGVFWKLSQMRIENKINSGGQTIDKASSFSEVLNTSDSFIQEYTFVYQKNELGYNLGLELDYHIKFNEGKGGGSAIGIKFGLNNPLIHTGWQIDKISASDIPDINFKSYYIGLVFKVL